MLFRSNDTATTEIYTVTNTLSPHDALPIYGARMTGGGFGGAVVMLARAGQGRAAAERVAAGYGAQVGRQATILSPLAPDSAGAAR